MKSDIAIVYAWHIFIGNKYWGATWVLRNGHQITSRHIPLFDGDSRKRLKK